jgi:hypothetical protein
VELVLAVGVGSHTAIVAGGYEIGVEECSTSQQKVELDFVVAGEAWVGSATPVILCDEVVDNMTLELALEVEEVVGDSDRVTYAARVVYILDGTATLV